MTLNDELHNTTLTEAVRQIDNLVQRAELEGNPLAATAFRFLQQYASTEVPKAEMFEKINNAGLDLLQQIDDLPFAIRNDLRPYIIAFDKAITPIQTYIDEMILP